MNSDVTRQHCGDLRSHHSIERSFQIIHFRNVLYRRLAARQNPFVRLTDVFKTCSTATNEMAEASLWCATSKPEPVVSCVGMYSSPFRETTLAVVHLIFIVRKLHGSWARRFSESSTQSGAVWSNRCKPPNVFKFILVFDDDCRHKTPLLSKNI